ncbi:MAG: hypothetical protein ACTIJ9_13850 [Aequorivita sp.]
MKNLETKTQDTFQDQLKKFKMLLMGSKMTKIASLVLIGFSFSLMLTSEEGMLTIISLLLGVAVMVAYMFKFLSLKNIEQKSYTQMSLISSITKFKTHMKNRKNNEFYYVFIWLFSLIPVLYSRSESTTHVIVEIVLAVIVTGVLGMFLFRKTEVDINNLETVMQTELEAFKRL